MPDGRFWHVVLEGRRTMSPQVCSRAGRYKPHDEC